MSTALQVLTYAQVFVLCFVPAWGYSGGCVQKCNSVAGSRKQTRGSQQRARSQDSRAAAHLHLWVSVSQMPLQHCGSLLQCLPSGLQ
jgi:hypothetical protein